MLEKKPEFCTCIECGWVYYTVTRAQATREVAKFNKYYRTLSKNDKKDFGGPSSIHSYEACWCGNDVFRPFKQGDCPNGVTIGPMIYETSKK